MQTHNSYYFNAYSFFYKLTLLIVCGLLLACSRQNDTKQLLSSENRIQISESAVNINTASVTELEKLPHVGTKKAQQIIEHREKFGRFRKPEYLLLVRGISDKSFREMRNLIRVE